MSVEVSLGDGSRWVLHDDDSMTPVNHRAQERCAKSLPTAQIRRVPTRIRLRQWALHVVATAVAPAVCAAFIIGCVALVTAERRQQRRALDEIVYALRYRAALNEAQNAGLRVEPGPWYPPLDACVRMDIESWYPCARAVLGEAP